MPTNDSSKTRLGLILTAITALLTLLTGLLATKYGQGLLGGPAQGPTPPPTPPPTSPPPIGAEAKKGPVEPAEKAKSTKRPTTLAVIQGPDRRPNTLAVIKVRLAAGGGPLAGHALLVFRVPFELRGAPLAVSKTDANGVLTLPLPGVGAADALRVEFPGDAEHEPTFVEIRG